MPQRELTRQKRDFEMLLSWKESQDQHICGCYRDQGLWVSACTVSAVYSSLLISVRHSQDPWKDACSYWVTQNKTSNIKLLSSILRF